MGWPASSIILPQPFCGFLLFLLPRRATHCIKLILQSTIAPVNHLHKVHVSLYFKISFDHNSTSSIPTLMAWIDDSESTLHHTSRIHKTSSRTAPTDVNNDNPATSTWTTLLNSETVEAEIDGTHPKMRQTETPRVAELKPKVDKVVPSGSEIESMIALQVLRSKKQIVAKEFQPLLRSPCTIYCNFSTRTHALESAQLFITSFNRYYLIYCAEMWLARILTGKYPSAQHQRCCRKSLWKATLHQLFHATDRCGHPMQNWRSHRCGTHHHKDAGTDECDHTAPGCKTRHAKVGITAQPSGLCMEPLLGGQRRGW